ncbi:hypothetical protein EJ06DRAFT_533530 [Trichodelitschia bisporula]|uniref:Uncharacterized protein n=1 Tax=Trichodelitschia bisporula TaxID=703511 RepID=A0A6G1HL51_9PEZI|nr:hypothetical protein EJ06DRAFT_533530 [Trichodelitschia bisporula]
MATPVPAQYQRALTLNTRSPSGSTCNPIFPPPAQQPGCYLPSSSLPPYDAP